MKNLETNGPTIFKIWYVVQPIFSNKLLKFEYFTFKFLARILKDVSFFLRAVFTE